MATATGSGFRTRCTKSSRWLNWLSPLYDKAARAALQKTKLSDIVTKKWKLEGSPDWKAHPVNTTPRRESSWEFIADMYDYTSQKKGTLVVEFTTKKVGGGCFSGAFMHE